MGQIPSQIILKSISDSEDYTDQSHFVKLPYKNINDVSRKHTAFIRKCTKITDTEKLTNLWINFQRLFAIDGHKCIDDSVSDLDSMHHMLEPSADHDSVSSVRLPYHSGCFRGVTESSENEDIAISHYDNTSYELCENVTINFCTKDHQCDNVSVNFCTKNHQCDNVLVNFCTKNHQCDIVTINFCTKDHQCDNVSVNFCTKNHQCDNVLVNFCTKNHQCDIVTINFCTKNHQCDNVLVNFCTKNHQCDNVSVNFCTNNRWCYNAALIFCIMNHWCCSGPVNFCTKTHQNYMWHCYQNNSNLEHFLKDCHEFVKESQRSYDKFIFIEQVEMVDAKEEVKFVFIEIKLTFGNKRKKCNHWRGYQMIKFGIRISISINIIEINITSVKILGKHKVWTFPFLGKKLRVKILGKHKVWTFQFFGKKLFRYFVTSKKRKKELGFPVFDMKSLQSINTDSLSTKIAQDKLFQDTQKVNIPSTCNFEKVCGGKSNRDSLPQDSSIGEGETSNNDSLPQDSSIGKGEMSNNVSLPQDSSIGEGETLNNNSLPQDSSIGEGEMSNNDSLPQDSSIGKGEMSNDDSLPQDSSIGKGEMSNDDSLPQDSSIGKGEMSNDDSLPQDSSIGKGEMSNDDSLPQDSSIGKGEMSNNDSLPQDSSIGKGEMSNDDSLPQDSSIGEGEMSNDDSLPQDSSIGEGEMSKVPHLVKSSVCVQDLNADNTKALENVDFRASLSEKGDIITSLMDDQRYLGLIFKLPSSCFKYWQEAIVYPLTRQDPDRNTPQRDVQNLMNYEVFRLCSFSYTRFPAHCDVWVTQLAQAGFYCAAENGRIICFACGQDIPGPMNSPVQNIHQPLCPYQQLNRPLHMWTQGLSHDVLSIYYNRYGSLRPYNFENSDYAVMTLDPVDDARGSSELTTPEPQLHQNEYTSSDADLLRAPDGTSVAMGHREESDLRDSGRPYYHSDALPTVTTESSHDYQFGNQRNSLPVSLNDVSGVLVAEESQDTAGSHQVLTSAARNPMPVYSAPSQSDYSQPTDGGSENGAVGGADPALGLSKASYPLYSSASARRQTFTTWSAAHFHQPDDLVAAGFFYAGYADCVRCFYCGLGLKFWRDTDIPAYQHARYRPHCVYNRLYKGQEYIDRVQQDIQAEQQSANRDTDQISMPRPPAPLAQNQVATTMVVAPSTETVRRSTAETTPAPGEGLDMVEHMNSEVAQAALRNGWQRYQVQQAIEHIVREFGETCLEIGILLDVLTNLNVMDNVAANLPSGDSTSSGDSGITESNMAPSSLASIRASAPEVSNGPDDYHGLEVSDSAMEERGVQTQDSSLQAQEHSFAGELPELNRMVQGRIQNQERVIPSQDVPAPHVEFFELFRSVERENTLLASRTTCRVCQVRPVSCIYLPCGHVIACQECADNASECLFCTKRIVGTANVFLA